MNATESAKNVYMLVEKLQTEDGVIQRPLEDVVYTNIQDAENKKNKLLGINIGVNIGIVVLLLK